MESQNQTDVKIEAQTVIEPTGDTGQVTSGQGVIEPQPAPEIQPVPYERFKEVNEAKKAAEQEAANLRAQFSLLQQAQIPVQPQQGQPDIFDGPGEDYEPLTRGEARKILKTVEERTARQTVAAQQFSARDQFIRSKPDYAEAVGVVDGFGRFAPSDTCAKVLAADPELIHELGNPATAPRIAYRATKKFLAEQELAALKGAGNQQQIDNRVALRTGPMSASAAGGGGAISPNVRPNPSTPEGKAQVLGHFQRILEGDFDT